MFKRNFTKIFLAAIIGLVFIAPAASQSINATGDGVVWLNSEESFQEVEASCSGDNNIDEISINGTSVYEDSSNNVTLETSDFSGNNFDLGINKEVVLNCNGAEDSTEHTAKIDLTEFKIESVKQEGRGFVGEVMKDESGDLDNNQGISLDYNIDGVGGFDPEAWEISMGEGLSLDDDYDTDEGNLNLYPEVDSYPDNLESDLEIERDGELLIVKDLNNESVEHFFVHDWKAEKVGDSNPGRTISYEEVEDGDYTFFLDMKYRDRSGLPESNLLESDNFRLTVKERNSEGDYESHRDESYEDMNVFTEENPGSGSDANYKVSLDEFADLDDLSSGRYKFQLEVVYDTERPEDGEESFLVDETIVDKSSEFSGVVLDSGGSGVVTEMVLTDGDSQQNVVTDSTGRFNTEIDKNEFTVDASFYRTSEDTESLADGSVVLEDAKLEDADLGPGGSAIRYDYLESPDVDIEGLNPVNMMMVKFGYPVESLQDVEMAFDSGKLDPQSMKVFECDAWNFEGEDCLTSWSSISEDDVTVNPATWTVSLDDTDLYEIEGEKILMNAYVIGSNSRIELQDAIDVPDLSIQSGETLEASGVLIDENGNRVEDANVTLSLIGGDGEWTASSDSTGSFEFQEDLEDVEKGNYQLRLEASKPPYEPLEKKSSSTVEVYYEKSINVDSQSEPLIPPGERYDIDYEVENNGQTAVKDIEFDVSGVNRNRYELSHSELELLEPGEIDTVTLTLDPPEEFETPPSIEFGALGAVEGEEVKGSATTLVSFDDSVEESENSTSDQENQTESNTETEDSNVSEEITRATGDFIQSQSDMNLALGLILVFGMILAVAVRKRKNDGGRDDRMNGRMGSRPVSSGGRVQKPDVSSKKVESQGDSEDEEESSSSNDSDEDLEESHSGDNVESDQEDEDDAEGFVCDKCGESFDTESGLKLHAQALH